MNDINDIIAKLKDALSRLVHPAPGIFFLLAIVMKFQLRCLKQPHDSHFE